MKSEYQKEIEKLLKDRGFKPTGYMNWTRNTEFRIVFNFWEAATSTGTKYAILLSAEIWLQSEMQQSSCFLAKESMTLTNEVIEKKGYAWIDEIIQDLYKYAYDILAPKVKIAAEAAITGMESIL